MIDQYHSTTIANRNQNTKSCPFSSDSAFVCKYLFIEISKATKSSMLWQWWVCFSPSTNTINRWWETPPVFHNVQDGLCFFCLHPQWHTQWVSQWLSSAHLLAIMLHFLATDIQIPVSEDVHNQQSKRMRDACSNHAHLNTELSKSALLSSETVAGTNICCPQISMKSRRKAVSIGTGSPQYLF